MPFIRTHARTAFQKISDDLKMKLGDEATDYDVEQISDPELKRKLEMLTGIGTLALDEEALEELNEVVYDMTKIYHNARVPSYWDQNKLIKLQPEVKRVMETSTNVAELEHYWTEWRKATGRRTKEAFMHYVDLINEAAM